MPCLRRIEQTRKIMFYQGMHHVAKFRAYIGRARRHLCTTTNKLVTTGPAVVEEKAFDYSAFFLPRITFQRAFRVARVVFVSWSIYKAGYMFGMVKYAQEPKEVEDRLVKVALGIDEKSLIEDNIHDRESEMHKRTKTIGDKIVASARALCAERLKYAQFLVTEASDAQETERLALEAAKWQSACLRLEGEWQFTVCKSGNLNAFVLSTCPRRIFINDGMIQKLEMTDDELALTIGHEVGHVILGHHENKALFAAALLMLQLVLMACVDPVLTDLLGFDLALAQAHTYITAGYSRAEEDDSDKVGLILTSLSCFNMLGAINLHNKLDHLLGRRKFRAQDTHPQAHRRVEALKRLAKVHEEERKTLVMFGKYRRDCVEQQASWVASVANALTTPSGAGAPASLEKK